MIFVYCTSMEHMAVLPQDVMARIEAVDQTGDRMENDVEGTRTSTAPRGLFSFTSSWLANPATLTAISSCIFTYD